MCAAGHWALECNAVGFEVWTRGVEVQTVGFRVEAVAVETAGVGVGGVSRFHDLVTVSSRLRRTWATENQSLCFL